MILCLLDDDAVGIGVILFETIKMKWGVWNHTIRRAMQSTSELWFDWLLNAKHMYLTVMSLIEVGK